MEGVISYFQKRHLSRGLSIGISYTIMIIITLFCIIFVSPLIIDQIAGIIALLGEKLSYLQQLFSTTPISTIIADQTRIPDMLKTNIISDLKNSS